ncbi:MAG: alpha/beta hydrolase [Anaerolineae bacterium]|nr:lysophospholipase [Thermoflexales bacterium]MDW8407361.1 alpha/beta hydrolase [Anaerolineae bacterium]
MLPCEEIDWHAADGAALFARCWRPRAETAGVICLIHGLGEHSGRYAEMAAQCAQAGYAVLAFDLRGHGKSAGRRGHYPSFDVAMDDVGLLLDWAEKLWPGRSPVLYGHSLGGNLALNYALRRSPAGLNAVIAASPALRPGFVVPPWKTTLGKWLYRAWPTFSLPNGLERTALSRRPEVIQAYLADPLVHDRVSARFGLDFLQAGEWALSQADRFSLPLLLMIGSADRLVSTTAVAQFAAKVGSRCTLKVWEGLYHETHNEPERWQVIDFALAWLAGLRQISPTNLSL